jgi:hypothetical protein
MSEHSEVVLRQALDSVDRLRRRQLVAMAITAVISQIAWVAFILSAERATEKTLLIVATFALAMTVFGGVFTLVIHTTRMTQRILQAIELSARHGG